MTAVTCAVLFRSESKDSGFHSNERPEPYLTWGGGMMAPKMFLTTVLKEGEAETW